MLEGTGKRKGKNENHNIHGELKLSEKEKRILKVDDSCTLTHHREKRGGKKKD